MTDALASALVPEGCGADFVATRHAGLARLEPMTTKASDFLRRSVIGEFSADGDALVLEMRYFPDIADAAIGEGLTFERNALPN